jgi:hypothetical protein
MFKKSKPANQLNLYSNIPGMLKGKSHKQYTEQNSWHNQFRHHVLMRIDENPFAILFSEKMGAPNAPVRLLLGMMILKEAFAWSDLQLFEECRFNLLVRSALGLFDINDEIPAESTYYLLRQRIYQYQKEHGVDLLEKVFDLLTNGQIKSFEISGKSIRMDSKLIGSNIAFYSRYQIIHQSLCLFYKEIHKKHPKLSTHDHKQILDILGEDADKTVYRSTRNEIQERTQLMGCLIYKILNLYASKENPHYTPLETVFHQQFKIVDKQEIELRPKEEITAQSIQSPHDTDCDFRNKNGNQVKGYTFNLTETCDEDELNLITCVQAEPASHADNAFVKPAIEKTEQVLEHKIDKFHADGAYNSVDNREYCQTNDIDNYITGIQGFKGRYAFELSGNDLQVTDSMTGEIIQALQVKAGGWKIKTEKGYRYFKLPEIQSYNARKEVESIPKELANRRNNVEATIFQFCLHTRNNKTRYRGLVKNKMWAILRCIWINLVRIINYIGSTCQRTLKNAILCGKNLCFSISFNQHKLIFRTCVLLFVYIITCKYFYLINQP